MKTTNPFAYSRIHVDVAAPYSARRARVIASTVSQAPGENSALRTGAMTTARSGSSGWSPPS